MHTLINIITHVNIVYMRISKYITIALILKIIKIKKSRIFKKSGVLFNRKAP